MTAHKLSFAIVEDAVHKIIVHNAELEAALAERDRMLRLNICDECGVNRSGVCSTPAPCEEASSCPPAVDTLANLRVRAEEGSE